MRHPYLSISPRVTIGAIFLLPWLVTAVIPSGLQAGTNADALRSEIVSLNRDLETLQDREKDLVEHQHALASDVRKIKAKNSTNFFGELQLQRKLRDLRDILTEGIGLDKKQMEIRSSLLQKKRDLKKEVRADLDNNLALAETAYRQRRIGEAERFYRDALELLNEHESVDKTLQDDLMHVEDGTRTPVTLRLIATGYETPGELREMAQVIMNHDKRLAQHLTDMEKKQKELTRELSIKKNLRRFQGVLARTSNSKGESGVKIEYPAPPLENQIRETDQRLASLEQRIKGVKRLRIELKERAHLWVSQAEKKENDLRGGK